MANSIATDISFQERILVSIAPRGEEDTQFESSLNEINWTGGGKDFDQDPLVSGGQHKNYNSQEPVELELTLYKKGVSHSEARGIASLFEANELNSASGNKAYGPSLDREDLRATVMTTEDPNATGATQSVEASYDAWRWIGQNMEIVSHEINFDDRTLQVEVTLKMNPFQPDGSINYWKGENVAGVGTGLDTVATYDSSFDITNPSGA